jgi:hypothetical protein
MGDVVSSLETLIATKVQEVQKVVAEAKKSLDLLGKKVEGDNTSDKKNDGGNDSDNDRRGDH